MKTLLRIILASFLVAAPIPVMAQTAGQSVVGYLSSQTQPNCAQVPCFVQQGQEEFNVATVPTVQNAAYSAGQSLGGLQTVTISSTNGVAGILDQIQVASTGGSTANMVIYVWDKNPTNTTCTDKMNFASSATDNQHLILPVPQSLTPALSLSAQDTSTRAGVGNLTANFVNSSNNGNLYFCLVANASVTPGSTTDLRVNLQGIKK